MVNTPQTGLTVGAVAALVGVSVRTLHHWDAIGLVRPSGRTWADYRVYAPDDIARIHRVLVYREVGIPLAQIGAIIDDPNVDERSHLQRQRELLTDRITRLQEMVSAVDTMMEVDMNQKNLTPEEMSEIFGTDWNPEYQEEAEQRWGDTEAWAQSEQRKQNMTKEDWEQIKSSQDALHDELAAAVRDGVDPASEDGLALAERHRHSIGQFYECGHGRHVLLGRMYTGDPRFTEYYEKIQPGLTQWLVAAIDANARANGVDPDTATWD